MTDAFRTVCWFHRLRLATGAQTTYQMDGLVEGPTASLLKGPEDRKNKWRSYKNGRHTPSHRLAQETEVKFPGSTRLLNHPVWPALRMDKNPDQLVADLLIQVPPDIFSVLRSGKHSTNAPLDLDGWSELRLRRLESQVSLDALASVVLLIRLAVDAGKQELAFELGSSLCRLLLMMGPWLTAHGIARPLAEYITEHVLALGHHNGQHHCFSTEGFVNASHRLHQSAWMIEGNENKRLTPRDRATLLLDLLGDKFSTSFSGRVTTCPQNSCAGAAQHEAP